MKYQLKTNMKRVALRSKQAQPLPIRIQHAYTYSKWDSIHEPYNVVENVLRDDDTVFKGLQPALDFTLSGGEVCYISEVLIWPGDSGPLDVELHVGNLIDRWTHVKDYQCQKAGVSKLTVPGEYLAKHLRIRCINNIRGGNLVNIRFVQIKGIANAQ